MDKKQLRAHIRAQKQAMTQTQISEKSAALGRLFAESDAERLIVSYF